MSIHIATYQRGRFVDIGWLCHHAECTASDIADAVKRGELPPPTPNPLPGRLVWDRAEAWRWIEMRGVRKTLRGIGG